MPHKGVQSDPFTSVLSPVIQSVVPTGASGSGTMDLTVNPAVGSSQTVLLVLDRLLPLTSPPASDALAYTFPAPPLIPLASPPDVPPPPTTQLTIPYSGVTPGTYLVRVEVDGANESAQLRAGR